MELITLQWPAYPVRRVLPGAIRVRVKSGGASYVVGDEDILRNEVHVSLLVGHGLCVNFVGDIDSSIAPSRSGDRRDLGQPPIVDGCILVKPGRCKVEPLPMVDDVCINRSDEGAHTPVARCLKSAGRVPDVLK